MGAIKITKIGNSQGVAIPKELLEEAHFSLGDMLEIHHYNGRLILFKKPAHHSKMKFHDKQDPEDIHWADADLGEWED